MPILTSALGSLPRTQKVVEQFYNYMDAYEAEESSRILDDYACRIIREQEKVGLDIVNDGEVRRSSYFTAFYDSFTGFLATAIERPYFLNDGRTYNHKRRKVFQVWQDQMLPWPGAPTRSAASSIIVDQLGLRSKNGRRTVFHEDARILKQHATRLTKITLPSPYMIMRMTYHPVFSRDAYKTRDDYLDDIIRSYIDIVRDIQQIGIDVIQFDCCMITNLLDPNVREHLDIEHEIGYYADSLNQIFRQLNQSESAVHICRNNSSLLWGEAQFLDLILKRLNVGQLNIALNDDDEDLLPLKYLPDTTTLLLPVVDTRTYKIDHPRAMLKCLQSALNHVPLEKIMFSSSCGFSPIGGIRRGLKPALNKLKAMTLFAQAINELGVSELAVKAAEPQFFQLVEKQRKLLSKNSFKSKAKKRLY